MIINVPSSLTLQDVLEFGSLLSNLEGDSFTFDFKNCRGVIEPFGMLMASSQISRLRKKIPNATVFCRNFDHMGYASHMGFFSAFGLNHGNKPGQASGSSTYIPLTLLNVKVLRDEALQQGVEVGERIEKESRRLALILCNGGEGDLFDTLSYSIRELMRNVVEHSEAITIAFCAQYWPTKNKVEVAILDMGIGLKRSLFPNPHIDVSSHKKAVNYALMPAVSGKNFKGTKVKQKGNWANSGFGLYMTCRISRNGGNFFIVSGDSGLLLTSKGEGKRYFETDFQGTAVRLVIKTDQLPNLRSALETYRKDGHEIKSKYKEIIDIDPSSASLMLSEDFDASVLEKIIKKLKGGLP
jgi:hypothetical protein